MSRVTSGTRRPERRKKILKLAKGFRGRRSTNFKAAKDAVRKSLRYAYTGRKDKKGTMRRMWISRINAAVRAEGMSYSRFICGVQKAGIGLNRKALSNLAVSDPEAFKAVVDLSKKAIGA